MMRRVLLASIALAVAASAGTVARATPAACADPCAISSVTAGYLPPVVEIAHGTTVHWSSLDTSHPTTDAIDDPCFTVPTGQGTSPKPARFTVSGGALHARTDGVTRTCHGAVAVGSGTFVQPYFCLLHPWMRGSLIVTTA